MDLGAFSICSSVKDLNASRDFNPKLRFESADRDIEQNSLILRNGGHVIGTFR